MLTAGCEVGGASLGEVIDGRRMARAKCKVSTVKSLVSVLFVSTEFASVDWEP